MHFFSYTYKLPQRFIVISRVAYEIAIKRAIDYYRNRGYSDKWIEARLKGILDRNKLTDVWKENGIKEGKIDEAPI